MSRFVWKCIRAELHCYPDEDDDKGSAKNERIDNDNSVNVFFSKLCLFVISNRVFFWLIWLWKKKCTSYYVILLINKFDTFETLKISISNEKKTKEKQHY